MNIRSIALLSVLAVTSAAALAAAPRATEPTPAETTRGAVRAEGETATLCPVISKGGLDVYRIEYEGNEPAMVAIEGAASSQLTLIVYDLTGRVVCRSTRPDFTQQCDWFPRARAEFVIEVRNDTTDPQRYRIWTN